MAEQKRFSLAVVMLSLNEGHHMEGVLENLRSWASEIFLVDSYSRDQTVDIALRYGVHVVQRRFRGFGDQWNFALSTLPIRSAWTMKIDPDERVSDALKAEIESAALSDEADAFRVPIRLWFMGRPLPARLRLIRAWKTGSCRFSDVLVNEHAVFTGRTKELHGTIEHFDSPNLHHWYEKQNRYTTAEAIAAAGKRPLAVEPNLFGNTLARRMWLKKNYRRLPARYALFFLYNYCIRGAWRAGKVGYTWARLRADYFRMIDDKLNEIQWTGKVPELPEPLCGEPDPRVPQFP